MTLSTTMSRVLREHAEQESDVIVVFKYEKKDEAIANILKKAKLKNTIAGIIFELSFQDMSFRLYQAAKQFLEASKTTRTK